MRSPLNQFFGAAALLLALPLLSVPAFADGKTRGGGGGMTVQDTDGMVAVDRYLARRKITDRKPLLQTIAAPLRRIAAVNPDLAKSLEADLNELDWYFVDKPLHELPFTRTKVPFQAKQTALQFDDNVFLFRQGYNELNTNAKKGDLVLHELMMRRFLKAEGVNGKLTKASVWKAVELLTQEKLPSGPELALTLRNLGFESQAIGSGQVNSRIAKLAREEEKVLVPLGLESSVTVLEAKAAIEECLVKSENSVFAKLGRTYFTAAHLSVTPLQSGNISFNADSKPDQFLTPQYGGTSFSQDPSNRSKSYGSKGMDPGYWRNVAVEPKLDGIDEDVANKMIVAFRSSAMSPEKRYQAPDQPTRFLASANEFPSLSYEFVENDRIYDDYGTVNPMLRLKNFSIAIPKAVVAAKGNIDFVNAYNKLRTPLKTDANEYIDCIRSELKKPITPGKLLGREPTPHEAPDRVGGW